MRAFVLAAVLAACSSTSTRDDPSKVIDDKGRKCSLQGTRATCDVSPSPSAACSPAATPCFVVDPSSKSPDDDRPIAPRHVAICDSCCFELGGSNTEAGDCSPLRCTVSSDCGGFRATCIEGLCKAE